MRTLFVSCALGSALVGALPGQYSPRDHQRLFWELHSQALINDTRSHGSIGDRWLSLREAILLNGRLLDENSLSAEERAQLQGFGTDIAWADIDFSVVPRITVERELPVIIDVPHGLTISGSGGRPVIDLRDFRGIVATSDFVDFNNLKIVGGDVGIHIRQRDTLFGSLIESMEFDGQGTAGIRIDFDGSNWNGRVQFFDVKVRNAPTAIQVLDDEPNRTCLVDFAGEIDIDNCDVGIDVLLGAGGQHSLFAQRMTIRRVEHAMRVLRLPGATGRALNADARHLMLSGNRSAFTLDAHPTDATQLLVQSVDLSSPIDAFRSGSLGTNLDLTIQDSRLSGSVTTLTGNSGKVQVDNVHLSAGRFDLGSTGANVQVTGSILDSMATGAVGSRQVEIVDSRLELGSVTGTATSILAVRDSYVNGTSNGGHVTFTGNLPDAPLGRFEVTPLDPTIGTTMTLQADLPPRLSGLYLFGTSVDNPTTIAPGLRLYADLSNVSVLQLPVSGQQQIPIPIPNAPTLVGLELYFHLAVGPDPGMTAPAVWLPPGRRVSIR